MNDPPHDQLVRDLAKLMHVAKERGLNWRVALEMARRRYEADTIPESPEMVLRALVEQLGPRLNEEAWYGTRQAARALVERARLALDRLPPALHLTDRGAKEES